MRVAVLFEDYSDTNHYLSEFEYARNVSIYDKSGSNTFEMISLGKGNLKQLRQILVSGKYDAFINLCEDCEDGSGVGEKVVEILHKRNVAYTGADPLFYRQNKLNMKVAASSTGVVIPDHLFFTSLDELDDGRLGKLDLPLIVKTANGHDSVGLTDKSVVYNRNELYDQVKRVLLEFGDALVEQFIDGPEFTVLVVENPKSYNEPLALTPVECQFPNDCRFKHFDIKWRTQDIKWTPVSDANLADSLKSQAKLVFLACNGSGYGRCDFRLDPATNKLYFLEINANCSVFFDRVEDHGSADRILSIDPLGHHGFVQLILQNALKRRDRNFPRVKLAYTTKRGFHLSANRNFQVGEVIYTEECKTAVVMSKQYFTKNWTLEKEPMKRIWFEKYAFLVGPDLYETWHDDLDHSMPVNHSCDPNCWISGLDVIARRPILKGEEITLEYATFSYLDFPAQYNEFECNCDADNCRKFIRPSTDYKLPGFREAFGDHVTGYIKALMNATEPKYKN